MGLTQSSSICRCDFVNFASQGPSPNLFNELAFIRDEDFIRLFVCLLEFYILTTLNLISGLVPACDSGHSWQLNSAAEVENQAASTMTVISTQ